MASSELKSVDVSISQVSDTVGAITLLNGVARGDDIDQRIARKVSSHALELRLHRSVVSPGGTRQISRVLVVLDKQANGASPAITDVLVSASPYSLYNRNNSLRFHILYDDSVCLNAVGDSDSFVFTTECLSLKFVQIFNSGDAGTIADITTNALYLITVGTEVAGATAGTVVGRTRYLFFDR